MKKCATENYLSSSYGSTNGNARSTAVSGGEPHDYHHMRGPSNMTPRKSHINSFVKRNGECGSALNMTTSFRMSSTYGHGDGSFTS